MSIPRNERQILEAMRAFGRGICGLTTKAPRTVAVEWWQHEDASRSIHLVNYSPKAHVRNIELEIALLPGQAVTQVLQHAPELSGPRYLSVRPSGDRIRVRVPDMDLYSIISY